MTKKLFLKYLNYFIIYSIIGFIFENIIILFMNDFNSGFLYGPWVPIYGFGVIIITLVGNYLFRKLHLKKILEIIIVFFSLAILLTLNELIGGYLIELIFHKVFWNYNNLPLHIGKYIAIEMSLLWGLMALLVLYVLNPFINKLVFKIPTWITITISILMIIDLIITLVLKAI